MQLIIILTIGKKSTKLVLIFRSMFDLCLSDYFKVSLGSKIAKHITNKNFVIFILNTDIVSLVFHFSFV